MAEDTLYLQLNKLSAITSDSDKEERLDQVLTTLWKTRRSGLRPPDKSRIHSLLSLPSLSDLDPVLASLRLLIRKTVHENLSGDDLVKLLPPDLSLELQGILVLLLQKYQTQWKEEVSKEEHTLPRTSVSYQVKASAPPSFTPLPSDIPTSLWPRQDDPVTHINLSEVGAFTQLICDAAGSRVAPLSMQQDTGPPDNLEVLPRLKSMTWTMENMNSAPANRVAIIHLKLQDYTRSPSGEIDVKFQLTKDTLEAMLRSMTYISEQLSNMAGTSSEPAQKKPKQ